jgi:endogenous inhibitor of DNA gyrase (YacG/DUF329 family)/predicted nucleic acid-binding Zn ribbon protein
MLDATPGRDLNLGFQSLHIRYCKICQKILETSDKRVHFCSDMCKQKSFNRYQYQVEYRKKKNVDFAKYQREYRKKRKLLPHPIYERPCKRCGIIFSNSNKTIDFCSDLCRIQMNKENNRKNQQKFKLRQKN